MMLWNVVLALLWVLVTEEPSSTNFLIGMALGLLVLGTFGRPLGGGAYVARFFAVVRLVLYFLWQLVLANLRVAYFIVMPLDRLKPGLVAVPLEPMSEYAVMVLANLITLTPGTMSVEVSEDRRTLFVHAMEVEDVGAFVREIKTGFEARVLEVMR